MRQTFYRFASNALWRLGLERLSMWFLMKSLETADPEVTVIKVANAPPLELPTGPFTSEVFWEDAEAIKELGDRELPEPKPAEHIHDLN